MGSHTFVAHQYFIAGEAAADFIAIK